MTTIAAPASASTASSASASASPSLPPIRYIAGDIGGTNSRLQLWEVTFAVVEPSSAAAATSSSSSKGKPGKHATFATTPATPATTTIDEVESLVAERTYPSREYSSLTVIIAKFIEEFVKDGNRPTVCCMAVAGPVHGNKCTLTNLSWVLDTIDMGRELHMDVKLINDFVAVGYGVLSLKRADLIPINDVPRVPEAPIACIGAGTGLGEAYLTFNSKDREYDVWPSEGGHADFAPRTEVEFNLLQYFLQHERVTRVSVERVVSGSGIPRIFDFFCTQHPHEVHPDLLARMRSEDAANVIAESAKTSSCGLCRLTIELFVGCYGAEAGNLAVKTLPFGGLFIAGGIAPKLLWAIQRDNLFWKNFLNKGRMSSLLEKVPVYIVHNGHVGLLGAQGLARRMLRREGFALKGELTDFTGPVPRTPDIKALVGGSGAAVGDVDADALEPLDDASGAAPTPSASSMSSSKRCTRRTLSDHFGATEQAIAAIAAAAATSALSQQQRQGSSGDTARLLTAAAVGGALASVCTVLLSAAVFSRVFSSRS